MTISRRAVLGSSLLALAGVAATTTKASAATPVSYAVAGDSLAAYSNSWLHQMNDPSVAYVGGYQHSGYTSQQVRDVIAPVDADVLVVMLGTNDVNHSVHAYELGWNIEAIARTVAARHVLISYLPPSNWNPDTYTGVDRTDGALVYTRSLVALAAEHGWLIADPFAPWRAYTGRWVGGASDDGTHPTTDVGAHIAQTMPTYIRQAFLAANP